tara:strand:+ start:1147 stop:1485 length:339 start_codon:yes stop_codon:yes gene_type:complete
MGQPESCNLLTHQRIETLMKRYPGKIPIVVNTTQDKFKLIKERFMVRGTLNVGLFVNLIRKYIEELKEYEALFMFFDNILIPNTTELQEVYDKYKKEDGVLYAIVGKESTFG